MANESPKVRRVVVKVGTSSVTEESLKVSGKKIAKIVSDVMSLRGKGVEVILISSGAIASGVSELGLKSRPREMKLLQATASVGQNELMRAYGRAFARHNQRVGQVLLTREDFRDRKSYINIKNTLVSLLKMGVVPVINENDSVSVEEIVSGDNDNLAATVAVNLAADALVMLSDSGFKMKRNDRQVVPVIPQITEEIKRAAGRGSARGKGGMASKIQAAEKTMSADVDLFIVDSKKKDAIIKVLFNPEKKTLITQNTTLFPSQKKLTDREHWMLFSSKALGQVRVDEGAKRALKRGGSLLPSGVSQASGSFKAGDIVDVADGDGVVFAKGITNYSSDETAKIMGKHSRELEQTLGRKCRCEVIHHGNMVFT